MQNFFNDKRFSDLNPIEVGYEDCLPNHSFGPDIREYYLIHYVKSGKGVFKTEKGEFEVNAGEAFLIKPGEVTTYTADSSEPWKYIWIGFNGRLANIFDRFEIPVIKIESRIFYEMCEVFNLETTKCEFLISKLFLLISQICESNSSHNDYINQAKAYINVNFVKPIKVSDIAGFLKLNRSYLCRIFKKKTGISLNQYIIKVRMEKAADYLSRNLTVGEISAMVGYTDPYTFSRRFKSYYGSSPRKYKSLK